MAASGRCTLPKNLTCIFITLLVLLAIATIAEAKDPQLTPLWLSSAGDSITTGFDAEYLGPNLNASWVNGYFGYWQWLSGLTNVRSHNQRISAIWGDKNRRNYINAFAGASMANFVGQAKQAVAQEAQYVTIFLGSNDVCQEQPWMIPSDESFEASFREGMGLLRDGLPPGATVYVVGLVDIRRLWDVAKYKKALGIVDCISIWSIDRFPCDTVLSPDNTEADREYAQSRNMAFNSILERVTGNYQDADPHHYYYYTGALFDYPFTGSDVSDIDCFHPSAKGQRTISGITWNEGPFSAYGR